MPSEDISAGRHVLESKLVLPVDLSRAAVLADRVSSLRLDLHQVTLGPLCACEIERDANAAGPHHLQLDVPRGRRDRQTQAGAEVAWLVHPDFRLTRRNLIDAEAAFAVRLGDVS